ncbi:hypothetical protein PSAB6_300119 [Paraburkholderia sabiae]|nr:hypothetical protein PSAB6_300119 [Paraburkholderia sabiae]
MRAAQMWLFVLFELRHLFRIHADTADRLVAQCFAICGHGDEQQQHDDAGDQMQVHDSTPVKVFPHQRNTKKTSNNSSGYVDLCATRGNKTAIC